MLPLSIQTDSFCDGFSRSKITIATMNSVNNIASELSAISITALVQKGDRRTKEAPKCFSLGFNSRLSKSASFRTNCISLTKNTLIYRDWHQLIRQKIKQGRLSRLFLPIQPLDCLEQLSNHICLSRCEIISSFWRWRTTS